MNLTPAEVQMLRSRAAAGDTVRELASTFALERRQVEAALAETPPPEEPMPKAETSTRFCSQCNKTRLRAHNRSGICSTCRRGGARKAPPVKRKRTKRRARKATKPKASRAKPAAPSRLPDVGELPADYLAACVREARRRVAVAGELAEALED